MCIIMGGPKRFQIVDYSNSQIREALERRSVTRGTNEKNVLKNIEAE
jgi:hypothetical protein